jgi:hypothetical protein
MKTVEDVKMDPFIFFQEFLFEFIKDSTYVQ